jgi:hypothetical protein
MSSGFNTDVQVGARILHVQTEDRGPSPHVIDTAVYQNGRVLYRHSHDYQHFADSAEFSSEGLRERVEEQHRCVIEDLRSGLLDAEIAAAAEKAAKTGGIQLRLLNPKSWLTGGTVLLELEILRRADHQPEEGVQVKAAIEGAAQDVPHIGKSDQHGRVQLKFPLPPLGSDDLTLVIQARNDSSKDEVRFAMRAKPKAPPAGAAR